MSAVKSFSELEELKGRNKAFLSCPKKHKVNNTEREKITVKLQKRTTTEANKRNTADQDIRRAQKPPRRYSGLHAKLLYEPHNLKVTKRNCLRRKNIDSARKIKKRGRGENFYAI